MMVNQSPMLLNLSNHPADGWSDGQREAAEAFGAVEDIPFPRVPPGASTEDVEEMADDLTARLQQGLDEADEGPHAVLVMGEMTLTAALVARLQGAGIRCLAATTERIVETDNSGRKITTFQFIRFREYPPLCP